MWRADLDGGHRFFFHPMVIPRDFAADVFALKAPSSADDVAAWHGRTLLHRTASE